MEEPLGQKAGPEGRAPVKDGWRQDPHATQQPPRLM